MPRALLLLFGLLMASCAHAIALDRKIDQLHHKTWLAKDGVPPSMEVLAQTEDGYLWIGTSAGLWRFDGDKFEAYQPRQGSYAEPAVSALKAQPGGGLWIGWLIGGTSFLKDGVLTNYGDSGGLGAGTVWSFAMDRDGTVWANGSRGLARFVHQRWQNVGPRQGFTGRRAAALCVDRDGTVGVFSEQGLFLWKPGASAFAAPIGKGDPRQPNVQPQRGPDGRIYLMDEGGIFVIDSLAHYGQAPRHWLHRRAQADFGRMLIDSSGSLWFDTDKDLHRMDPDSKGEFDAAGLRAGTETFAVKDGHSDGLTGAIIEDREHNVWVLTTAGLERFRQVDVNKLSLPGRGDNTQGVRMLPGPDATMYLAGLAMNSTMLQVSANGVVRQRAAAGHIDSPLLRTRDGALWHADSTGLRRWPELAPKVTLPLPPDMGPYNTIHVLAEASDGTLWASVRGAGVFHYCHGRWEREPLLPDQGKRTAMSILADRQGRMWFGYADNTIARLDGRKATLFSRAQGVDLQRIAELLEADGQLWAGGQNGLALLRGERFTPVRTAPVKAETVSAIRVAPSGDMWLNTGGGVLRLPAAEVRAAIADAGHVARGRTFDAQDGVVGLATLPMKQSLDVAGDGKVWFSTRDATAWIDPAHLLPPVTPPAVLIASLRAGDTHYRDPLQPVLPPHSRDVQIDYTVPLLATPERLRFRFFLEGYDQQWHDAGARRQAFYTGLPPGDYHFRVMAEHGDGNWGPEGAGLRFSVLPAWYQTWWFKTLVAAAATLLAWLLYRFRLKRIEMQYQVQLEVRQAERERIARELHDTLLQGTQALILDFHNAAARLPAEDPAREPMERALERADIMLAEGREQVHDLRASDLFGVGVAALIARDGAALAKARGIAFTWRELGRRREVLPATAHELYRIAMEAIVNALQHAEARSVRVKLTYGVMSLQLAVADDGKGVPPAVLARGGRDGHWGLPGLHERAARLRAHLRIDSRARQGTVVRLRIPGHIAYGCGWASVIAAPFS